MLTHETSAARALRFRDAHTLAPAFVELYPLISHKFRRAGTDKIADNLEAAGVTGRHAPGGGCRAGMPVGTSSSLHGRASGAAATPKNKRSPRADCSALGDPYFNWDDNRVRRRLRR